MHTKVSESVDRPRFLRKIEHARHLARVVGAGVALTSQFTPAPATADVFRIDDLAPDVAWLAPDNAYVNRDCSFAQLSAPLGLAEAVDRALCNGPKTRASWASVKAQAAQVGQAMGAYLPTANASFQSNRDDQVTSVEGYPTLSSSRNATVQSGTVSVEWLIYDFGARRAVLKNAQMLLASTKYQYGALVQETISTVTSDFYDAQAASAKLLSAKESEEIANSSVKVATARVKKGVAPISDQLQAETAYIKAKIARAQAEKGYRSTAGTLLADMYIEPTAEITLSDSSAGVRSIAEFDEPAAVLVKKAEQTHPSVSSAKAVFDAAIAKEDEVRSQGFPKLSFVAQYSRNNQPSNLGLGSPQFPSTSHEWYLGIRAQIPIFEGFVRSYQVREAHAKAEQKASDWDDAKRQAGLNTWKAYQSMTAASRTVQEVESLISSAQAAFSAAQKRYLTGIAGITELLNTQTALADARQQRDQAIADWNVAKMKLASTIGRLDARTVARLTGR